MQARKFGPVAAAAIWGLLALAGAGSAKAADPPPAATVQASVFEVTGNTLLGREAVDKVLEPFKGRRTLAELNAAAQALQRLYVTEGYGGVVAYVPPQTRTDGVVTIAVLEGKVAAITVRGARVFDDASIKASLPDLVVGATPRMRGIDAQMQIANENPARRLRVLLKPGQRAGEIEAEVTVQEAALRQVTASLDDTGNTRTGEYRASIGWTHANLSGNDDVLSVQYQTSPTKPSQVTVVSAGYRLPLYRALTIVDAFLAYSDVDGGSVATAAGDLRFNGNGRIAGVRGTWILPRAGEADQRVAVGLDMREYRNTCGIGGQPNGACGTAGESVSVQPLSLEYTAQRSGDPGFGLSVSLHSNLNFGGRYSDAANFAAVRPAAVPRYTALRYSAFGQMAVAESWELRLRVAGQFTDDALVPGEQFGIGGASSVRGYDEREVLGDTGLLASLELTGPQMMDATRADDPKLRLFAFADAGRVQNQAGAPCLGVATRCTLAAWGVGARFEWGKLQARLALAQPLRDAVRTRKNDGRVHFAVVYTF
jgi:hemolysin activation/secretion protein